MDRRHLRRLIVVALLLLLAASSAAALGDQVPVRLNGIPVLEVVGTKEESARARAERIERRLVVEVPVGYGTDLRAAEHALLSAAHKVSEVLHEPKPSIRVRELGAADVLMELRFWTDSRRADLLATMSSVRSAVVEEFREAGLPLPEPDLRRLRIDHAQEDTALRRHLVKRSK